MSDNPTYEYADGNGNVYILSSSSLEYVPVKKEESSSGMYSGGQPRTVNVSGAQYKSIRTLLDAALNDTTIQIGDRVMMSGVVRLRGGEEDRSCIIKPGSTEISSIENALKAILGDK